jgi:D-alanyl-D-alanine carboxypeptidase (penicillin-binding protein 5/6)
MFYSFSSAVFAEEKAAAAKEPQKDLGLTAKSAVLMNTDTGDILYSLNENDRLPEASMTKVMTLLLVMEAIDSGKITFEDMVSCSEHASSMGGTQIYLEPGEQMTVRDLIKSTVVASANDAAVALGEYVAGSHEMFVTMMNDKARDLGMKNTSYKNCTGLDAEGHLTSALDVAIVSRELLKHESILEYTQIWMDSVRNGEFTLSNTNKLIKQYKGANGLKTGTTSQAGCCVTASAERDGMKLIAVVMGTPNSKSRFGDATKLLDYGFANWELADVESYKPELSDVSVIGGVDKSLPAECGMSGYIVIPKGQKDAVVMTSEIAEDVSAPVEQGECVGKITLSIDDKILGEYNVVTSKATEKVTFGTSFKFLLRGLLRM